MQYQVEISIANKTLKLINKVDGKTVKSYAINTSRVGPGETMGSNCTPTGRHIIRAKIGAGMPLNTIFRGRRANGEIYKIGMKDQFPDKDWILTRILWLSGKEPGKNRLGNVDTMRRYIYIHGCPDDYEMRKACTIGCINMRNADLIELFDKVAAYTPVVISE